MSLHGLLRHLAGTERWWFRPQFAGEDVPPHNGRADLLRERIDGASGS